MAKLSTMFGEKIFKYQQHFLMNKINIFIINKNLKNKGNDFGKIIPFLFQIKLKYMLFNFYKKLQIYLLF